MAGRKSLWTRDFARITLSTILSAIGGEAMSLPVSLLVFDQTRSTLLSSLILIFGFLPDVLFSVLAAPVIDRRSKKRWIIALDVLNAALYAGMGAYIAGHPFSYGLYAAFTLAVATISVFYRLAYQAWYPDLIPAGFEQKGYAVSSTIYPMVIIVMAPVASFLYERVSMTDIFFLVAGMTLLSVLVESRIHEDFRPVQKEYTPAQYAEDILEGFRYLRREKGIRNIYSYMSVTNGVSEGVGILVQAFYQTQAWLTVTMLGFLSSALMLGRFLGGVFQYAREIPVKKRFAFTKMVYTVYNLLDAVLLFLPYPLMLLSRFICGALGVSSATIRAAAVQSYLPANIRARVNALFNMLASIGIIFFDLVAGLLGQALGYRPSALLLGAVNMIAMILLIFLPAEENRSVYEATRADAPPEQPPPRRPPRRLREAAYIARERPMKAWGEAERCDKTLRFPG